MSEQDNQDRIEGARQVANWKENREKRRREQGLYARYIISKTDGSAVDPDAQYFVLRLDDHDGCDPKHTEASRAAAIEYSVRMREHMPKLALELAQLAVALGGCKPFRGVVKIVGQRCEPTAGDTRQEMLLGELHRWECEMAALRKMVCGEQTESQNHDYAGSDCVNWQEKYEQAADDCNTNAVLLAASRESEKSLRKDLQAANNRISELECQKNALQQCSEEYESQLAILREKLSRIDSTTGLSLSEHIEAQAPPMPARPQIVRLREDQTIPEG